MRTDLQSSRTQHYNLSSQRRSQGLPTTQLPSWLVTEISREPPALAKSSPQHHPQPPTSTQGVIAALPAHKLGTSDLQCLPGGPPAHAVTPCRDRSPLQVPPAPSPAPSLPTSAPSAPWVLLSASRGGLRPPSRLGARRLSSWGAANRDRTQHLHRGPASQSPYHDECCRCCRRT